MNRIYTFPYGKSQQTVALPEEHVRYVLRGQPTQPAADVRQAVRQAVEPSLAALTERIGPDERVVIVVSDATRAVHTEEMLDVLLERLQAAGISLAHIRLLVALGTHRPATKEELVQICGPRWAGTLQIVQHDCRDAAQLVRVGCTSFGNDVYINRQAVEADHLILTGGISFHDMAGFSGGRKAVLPGLAGYDTIMRNHGLALNDEQTGGMNEQCRAGNLLGNAMHDDMVEGVSFINPDYMVNTVLSADGSVYDVVAGHWLRAWEEGCRLLSRIDTAYMPEQADVVITSAGGYPKDINFYQATKAHMNAVFAVKPGGIMIVVMDCPDSAEPPEFARAFAIQDGQEWERQLRQEFTIPSFSAYKTKDIIQSLRAVYAVTRPENNAVMIQSGQIPTATLEEAWHLAQEQLHHDGNETYTIAVMPYGASTLPAVRPH
ncbi:nickel-dependent lactate racemase [uncultured Megasphaera sp.]|uniref:nickel-dependent lactate racemase n=1 Tax=uncultured Megasphaera sp. TaxID=165188 RepID=UPI002658F05C|nr:nickel-dependent lactate racemase [uncultured Megasphaera sp.]